MSPALVEPTKLRLAEAKHGTELKTAHRAAIWDCPP